MSNKINFHSKEFRTNFFIETKPFVAILDTRSAVILIVVLHAKRKKFD